MSFTFSREVDIGGVVIGGCSPVRVQSMTNTATLDTAATLKQCIALIEAGCDYVRIATPGMREAENFLNIKNILRQKKYHTPLIADVHYRPEVAEFCAGFAEKVRINPGNYADKFSNAKVTYDEKAYNEELERIAHRLRPLIKKCKVYGTAIRIGTNHGSLSQRILNRYGDTAKGMVEATMEFLRIFSHEGFKQLVVSLKASNPLVMIEANRLLWEQMLKEDLLFPVHLGVTEAGMGEDGRIKSALGIGTLLKEGIGDTIRVSLTESPVQEIPFAKKMVELYGAKTLALPQAAGEIIKPLSEVTHNFCKKLRPNYPVIALKTNSIKDILALHKDKNVPKPDFYGVCYKHFNESEFSDAETLDIDLPKEKISLVIDVKALATFHLPERLSLFINITGIEKGFHLENLKKIKNNNVIFVLRDVSPDKLAVFRQKMSAMPFTYGMVLELNGPDNDFDKWLIQATVEFGSGLIAQQFDGFLIHAPATAQKQLISACFGILQATRLRISKTEFIACPSCGRTVFDIQKALKDVIQATGHLKGLKIGVMGCIVNGPGEMADADYGYVGNAKGLVNIYRGRQVRAKNIKPDEAISYLVNIIKSDGRWFER